MTRRRAIGLGTAVLLLAGLGWAVVRGVARLAERLPTETSATVEPAEPPVVPRITATLFYGAADGQALVSVQREIALADGVVPQGREIIAAQLQGAPSPYLSVIPEGTTLRAFYVTDRGDAFVDLSPEVSSKHRGGSSAELLTVYAIVNALTTNLPAVRRVQILINGQEADTLAGHIDLRNPLERDTSIVNKP